MKHSIDELREDHHTTPTVQREETAQNDASGPGSAERFAAMDRQIAAMSAMQEPVRSLVMRDVSERLGLFEASLRECAGAALCAKGRPTSPAAFVEATTSHSQIDAPPVRRETFDVEIQRIWQAIDGSMRGRSQAQAIGTNGTVAPQSPNDPLLGSVTRSTIQLVHALAQNSSSDQPVQRSTGVSSSSRLTSPTSQSRPILSYSGQPVSLHSPTVPNPFRSPPVSVQPPTIMVSCPSPSVPPQRIVWTPDRGGSLVSCPGRQGA